MRRCDGYREALSARLDGEAPGVPAAQLDAHLDRCPGCRRWAAAAGGLAGRSELSGAPAPAPDPARPRTRARRLGPWRVALAALAAAQLAVAWAGLLAGGTHAGHATRELTSWDLGLAAGFLVLAWLPSRAWGALPVVAVIVALLAGTSAADLAAGRADLGREWVHGLQVAGLACLWVLAHRAPRPPVVVRLRSARPA
jgi:predicted anti-sigma-YlaC factor YlaD